MLLATASLTIWGAGWACAADAAPDPAKTKKPWEVTLAAGTSMNSGNTDTRLNTATAVYEYKGKPNELLLNLDYAYGTQGSTSNVDNASAKANYHYRFSDMAFAVADASATRDGIASLEYRFIASPGLGLYLLKNETVSLFIEGGPGYLMERKGDTDNNVWIGRAAERLEWRALATSKPWEAVEYIPHINDFNEYIINAEVGVEASVTSLLSIRLVFKDTYDSAPATGKKNNDATLAGSIGVKL
jgi:putative salt-induced outer membrane protein YdiY